MRWLVPYNMRAFTILVLKHKGFHHIARGWRINVQVRVGIIILYVDCIGRPLYIIISARNYCPTRRSTRIIVSVYLFLFLFLCFFFFVFFFVLSRFFYNQTAVIEYRYCNIYSNWSEIERRFVFPLKVAFSFSAMKSCQK